MVLAGAAGGSGGADVLADLLEQRQPHPVRHCVGGARADQEPVSSNTCLVTCRKRVRLRQTSLVALRATQFLQISPNDGGSACQTPLELQMNKEEGTASGAFWRAINTIAEALAPRWPNTKIVSLSCERNHAALVCCCVRPGLYPLPLTHVGQMPGPSTLRSPCPLPRSTRCTKTSSRTSRRSTT